MAPRRKNTQAVARELSQGSSATDFGPLPATAEEAVRSYSFTGRFDREVYPEGGIYHIRAARPDEYREFQELMGRTEVERDPKTKEIIRDGRGNPLRVSNVTEAECLTYAKKFIGEIERIEVEGKRITVKSPEFDLVLQHMGKSDPYEVELDADGNVIKPSDKVRPFTCPHCRTHIDGVKVASTKTLYKLENVWYWVVRTAHEKLRKNNEARAAALGNS